MPERSLTAKLTDITKIEVDAIINAANRSLLGGGGVDGAIHRAAGPGLLNECRRLKGCETGQAKVTAGHLLKAKYVIHTVGPVWQGGHQDEASLLSQCYRNVMTQAAKLRIDSIAFPAISCGVYGYPLAEAVSIAVREINVFPDPNAPTNIHFVCFSDDMLTLYKNALALNT
ncbi:MAG: O-acetyl-ADP-ribose deacetylase [Gammaproteobacteria bacterium]